MPIVAPAKPNTGAAAGRDRPRLLLRISRLAGDLRREERGLDERLAELLEGDPQGTVKLRTLSANSGELITESPASALERPSGRSTSYWRFCCRNFWSPASLNPLPTPITLVILAERFTLEKNPIDCWISGRSR